MKQSKSHFLATRTRVALLALPVIAALALSSVITSQAEDAKTEKLELQLPSPTLKGTPIGLPTGPNIDQPDKVQAALMVSKGAKNVAAGKPVTSSVKPFANELSQVTDGKKEAFDYDTVEFKKGAQWVQVDLGQSYKIEAIAMWHDHRYLQVMNDVIVLVSDDPEFKDSTKVTTLYNNDTDNSSGLGVGTDREYFETNLGRVVDGKGTSARYVRCYTKGGSAAAFNYWQELEVYAVADK